MKVIKKVFLAIIVLAILLAAFFAHLGLFSKVKVVEQEMGPYTLVYEQFVGDYKKTGPIFMKVYKSLLAEGITTNIGLGIYYDDPSKVPVAKLKSDIGSILEPEDVKKAKALKKKNFSVQTIHKKKSLVVEFPVKSNLSYMIAPMKTYPALMKYAKEKGYSSSMTYEMYYMKDKKILTVMELAK